MTGWPVRWSGMGMSGACSVSLSPLRLTPAGTALLAAAERVVDAGLGDELGSHMSVAEVAELTALLRGWRGGRASGECAQADQLPAG
jgi:hypothetical protein